MKNKKKILWLIPLLVLTSVVLLLKVKTDSERSNNEVAKNLTTSTSAPNLSPQPLAAKNSATETSPITGGFATLTPTTLALGKQLLAADALMPAYAYDHIKQGLTSTKNSNADLNTFLTKTDCKTCFVELFKTELANTASTDPLNLLVLARILALPDFDEKRAEITALVKDTDDESLYGSYLRELKS